MVIIIVLTSSFARKLAKEQAFPLSTRLWYLALAILCTWTRNKINGKQDAEGDPWNNDLNRHRDQQRGDSLKPQLPASSL